MNLDNQPTPRAPVRRFAFLAIVAALAAMPFGTAAADPGGRNRIDGVTSSARAEETIIRMRGSRTPTFTMYKLDRPARLVVDVSSAELADSLRGEDAATFSVNTWAVQQVTAHETGEGSRRGVRLVVSLARPSTYDVKVDGRDLVVRVTARERAPVSSSTVSAAASAAAASEKAAAARAMSDAKRMMDEAASLKRQAEETAAQARRDVAAAKADAERARTDARARDEQAKARLADAASMKKEAAAELAAANQAKSAAAAEEKRARERAVAARGAEATAAQRRD
ncbi:MAG TPA: AMIN domain-containing protein, partial [Kofleriaceae bacterium]|nr:AMIN domain-containing protein [Kofleriaceae bacterium]